VRIRFTNDALSSTEDRNLLLDVVRSAAGSGGGSGGGSGAGFTLPDGGSADAAATGGGYLVAHAATPLADDTGPALEVDVDGSPAQVAPVTGPVPRPVVAALPNGTHNVTFRAHGGTVLVQDWAVQAALPPADVTGAAARVHSGGSAEGSGWRFTDFGSLETDLVVPDSGWYLLRVQGVASVGSVGPLVHLWLNRTVVAEGTQGATVDLAQPVYLQGLVGATMGASFENPTGGSTVRIDRVSATPTDAPPPPGPAMSLGANTDPDGWPQYGRDAWNTRSNPDPALPDAARAGRLGLQWRTQLDGSVTGTPAVAGGTVFVGTWGKSLYALDEADGSVRWRAALPDRMDDSPAVAQGVVLGGAGASLLAFDAANGTQLWRHDFTGHLWASPVVDGSDVFIGVDSDRGYVAKLDVATGAVAWQVATTDVPNTGARVWATPLVPPGSGLVVVGTSPGNDNGQPATMDSLLALDRDSGSVVWAHRLFPGVDTNNDSAPAALAQNRDISGTPHLALLDGRPVVLASEKHGPAWALDLATGQLVHGSRMPTPRTTLLGSGGTAQGVEVVSGTEPDRVAAFDLATGDLRWEQALPTTDFAPVAIGQGVVWIGAWDGKLRAFDLASGHALAAYDAGGGVMGGAALAHGAVFVGALQMPSSGSFNDSLGKLPGYMSKWS
jgi:polyvinyl alcohol dehydrogenase (cytochrome)